MNSVHCASQAHCVLIKIFKILVKQWIWINWILIFRQIYSWCLKMCYNSEMRLYHTLIELYLLWIITMVYKSLSEKKLLMVAPLWAVRNLLCMLCDEKVVSHGCTMYWQHISHMSPHVPSIQKVKFDDDRAWLNTSQMTTGVEALAACCTVYLVHREQ